MNPLMKQIMGRVSQLTLAGDLGAATAAIQEALAHRPPTHSGSIYRAGQGAIDVIDVVARVVPDTPQARPPQREAPAPGADQFLRGTHTDALGSRDYKLYVPPNHAGRALPLVVMLHGCTQDPDDFAAGTGMNEAARAEGFFVLYPAQAQSANPQRCWKWFKHNHQKRDRGEPAILANMTREVMKQYRIDPDRVYVAGLSAGGAMAAILGQAYPELYKAVGVHSGLAAGSAKDVAGALMAMKNGPGPLPQPSGHYPPVIVFHGDRDATVHPANADQLMAAAATHTVVTQEQAQSDNGHRYTRRVHKNGEGRVVAEQWVVHGSAHAWSGGRPQGSYTDPRGPDATQEMLRFFKASGQAVH